MKKTLFSVLVLVLVTVLSISVFAATYTDIDGHWAEESIERWTDEKVLNGYSDGTFKPNNLLTRAEYVAIISRMFEPKNTADLSKFKDLDKDAWYYDSFAKVFTLNAIQGTSSTTMNPNANITRQEAIVILNRILDLKVSGDTKLTIYKDSSEIANWAQKAILAFTSNGYVNGYEDETVRPTRNISRAECAKILDACIGRIIRKSGEYDLTGVKGSIIVLAEDVTLKNADLDKVFVSNDSVKKSLKIDNSAKTDVVIIDETQKSSRGRSSGGGSSSSRTQTLKITFTTVSGDESGDIYNITKEGTVKDGVKLTVIVDGETIYNAEEFSEANFAALKEKAYNYAKANARNRADDCEKLLRTAYKKYYLTDKKEASVALVEKLAAASNITKAERSKIRELRDLYESGAKTGKQIYKENIATYRGRLLDAYTALTYDMVKEGLNIL